MSLKWTDKDCSMAYAGLRIFETFNNVAIIWTRDEDELTASCCSRNFNQLVSSSIWGKTVKKFHELLWVWVIAYNRKKRHSMALKTKALLVHHEQGNLYMNGGRSVSGVCFHFLIEAFKMSNFTFLVILLITVLKKY